jgi:hypothetical protein
MVLPLIAASTVSATPLAISTMVKVSRSVMRPICSEEMPLSPAMAPTKSPFCAPSREPTLM